MPFISVTRLRVRGWPFLPPVVLHSWRSGRQLRGAAGFLGGYLASGRKLSLWTVTMWEDEAAMRAYRDAAPHLKAMPRLVDACDEAAVAHWTAAEAVLPTITEAAERMAGGRLSEVRHPSAAHAAGEPWPGRKTPRRGPSLPL